jgi:hypothetical protein
MKFAISMWNETRILLFYQDVMPVSLIDNIIQTVLIFYVYILTHAKTFNEEKLILQKATEVFD